MRLCLFVQQELSRVFFRKTYTEWQGSVYSRCELVDADLGPQNRAFSLYNIILKLQNSGSHQICPLFDQNKTELAPLLPTFFHTWPRPKKVLPTFVHNKPTSAHFCPLLPTTTEGLDQNGTTLPHFTPLLTTLAPRSTRIAPEKNQLKPVLTTKIQPSCCL